MHETRIAMDLAKIVIDVAVREGLSRVTQVNLQFGQMIQIVPDTFKFAFTEAIRNTVAENSIVNLEIVPIQLRCNNCKYEFNITNLSFKCTRCNSINLEIIRGKEMLIKSIEGE
jgi:hydrogenase nickel incorporation protein HypA/HybF